MGRYFNPPTKEAIIAAGGRELETDRCTHYLFEEDYKKFTNQLKEGEVLVGLYDRWMQNFSNAVWMVDFDEMLMFEEQFSRGIILRNGFFALPSSCFRAS